MPSLTTIIASAQNATCAILRIRPSGTNQFQVGFAGTGFGVVKDKYVATAYHIFDGGQPRQVTDKFYAFVVPGNGPHAYHFPVVGFPLERADLDFAVIELGPCATVGVYIEALPIHAGPLLDGARVATYGFPSPIVSAATVDPAGNYGGGQFLLKGYANEGIVAAQYELGPSHILDFNVAWFHGESGGPVIVEDSGNVVAVMQSYRGTQSPNGVIPGPRAGRPLHLIGADLSALGALIV